MDSEQFSVNGGQLEDDYVKIALTAYENARMDGLCHDGALECALTAVSPSDSESKAQLLAQLKQRVMIKGSN